MDRPVAPAILARAVARLRGGGLVAFPTETVYGLGADARDPLAVRRIFATKGRPVDHPVIVHLPGADALPDWAVVPDAAWALAARFWPGPLTLVLRRVSGVLDEVTGGRDTVGLRVPDHPVAAALLAAFGDGIAAPSANRFGRVSPTSAAHVREELGDELLVLDGGECQIGIESTILDLSGESPALLRPGAVTRADLEAVIGPVAVGGTTAAPGTLPAHYAPRTALELTHDAAASAAALAARGLSVAILPPGPPADLARRLYAELRRLGFAVNDRLTRAARGAGRAPHDP